MSSLQLYSRIQDTMRNTQFKTIPPLDDIQKMFCCVTGVKFFVESTWYTFVETSDPDIFLQFMPYIRPSHQKILLDTANGKQKNPCSLLRQLLRPHGFTILFEPTSVKGTYCLKKIGPTNKNPHIDDIETVIDWTK